MNVIVPPDPDGQEQLAGLQQTMQTLQFYPGQHVEHVAFERIHHDAQTSNGTFLRGFVRGLVAQRVDKFGAETDEVKDYVLDSVETYARKLTEKFPEAADDHKRRAEMWRNVLETLDFYDD